MLLIIYLIIIIIIIIIIITIMINHNHNYNMFQQMLRVCGTSLVSPGWHIPGITAGTCVEYKTVISNQ